MMIKNFIKKFIPKNWLLFYHKILAYLAAFFYGWPSKKLIVIGVTGTAGKSTTVNLIGKILAEAGFKIGLTTTMNFKIEKREWVNKTKMTMPGRFFMQKILKKMVEANCQYAIIETSSEGILQSRHLGIDYDIAVFTGLHPEHLEAHGGFENYKKTKGKLFEKLEKRKEKFINGKRIKKVIVVNLDDENANYFLSYKADEYYGYGLNPKSPIPNPKQIQDLKIKIFKAENIKLTDDGSSFTVDGVDFKINLLGEFNIYNCLASIAVALSQNIDLKTCQRTLEKINFIPGRMEIVVKKPFKVIIDYAHTPKELENVYQLIKSKIKTQNSKIIGVLGSAGGGRDKWKRPVLGKIAAQYCDFIILTNEDPYDENPKKILSEIKTGILNSQFPISNLLEILDRKEAIKKAISLAKENDIVVITGKGSEPWMCVAKDKKIPWDDKEIVKDFVEKK